jgi:hypothetical protein
METAERAVTQGRNMPKGSSWEELTAYRYVLNQNRKKLLKLQMELDERQQATDAERAEQVANEASREQGHPASKRLSRVDKIP